MSRKTRPFRFKQFEIYHDECAMKVGTDGVLVGAWANIKGANYILDIGTGTGLIAIMAAQKNKTATIDAIDIDDSAIHQATKNINNSPWKNRIHLYKQSLQNFISEENKLKYDLIISNPPYFNSGSEAPQKKRQIARHTETLSHIELAKGIAYLLAPTGKCAVILPYQEGLLFQKMMSQFDLHLSKLMKVQSKKDKPIERLLLEFQRKSTHTEETHLIIQHDDRNDWTTDYIQLTKAFYLHM